MINGWALRGKMAEDRQEKVPVLALVKRRGTAVKDRCCELEAQEMVRSILYIITLNRMGASGGRMGDEWKIGNAHVLGYSIRTWGDA
jgi:hypothetical protein